MANLEINMQIENPEAAALEMEIQSGGGSGGGGSETAERLRTARRIALEGEAAGSTLFDGSQDVTLDVTINCLSAEEVLDLLGESGGGGGSGSGGSETAERLKTPRKIELAGDVTGEVEFDGSQDVVIQTQVKGGGAGFTEMTEEEVEGIWNE